MGDEAVHLLPGNCYAAARLLDLVSRHQDTREISRVDVGWIFGRPGVEVIRFCTRLGLIGADSGRLFITNDGNRVITEPGLTRQLRAIISAYIRTLAPAWAHQIPKGRGELLSILDREVRQCFAEADLTVEPPSAEVVEWWDSLADYLRTVGTLGQVEVGRRGERMSIEWEQRRTGRTPKWVAFESNVAGYDLLSSRSEDDPKPLSIEVKTSTFVLERARLVLTRHEWDVAELSDAFVFHLWCLEPEPRLAVVGVEGVRPHVPLERGRGVWETTVIPMAAFKSEFVSP